MAYYEKDKTNTSDTIFSIGSITKSFTAVAVMQLHEDGLLNLDEKVITVHQLLTHTSGLP